jgi:hypothetical protein
VRCEAAQQALSEAMDAAASVSPQVEAHRSSCPVCTRFEEGAWRIRELTRFEALVPPVPDVASAVMQRVREYEADRMLGWIPEPHPLRKRLVRQRFALAALVTGLIIGLVLTSGGLIPVGTERPEASAEEIPQRLVRAAKELVGYRATFRVTELNWTKEVRSRSFEAALVFNAPESFRVQVTDTTRYPSARWPRNDLLLVTNGRAWQATGPDPCPAAALPVCPRPGPVTQSIVNRSTFDSRSSMPTDVIVPMTVLAASDRVQVIGPDQVAGREAVAIGVAYQDGASLFQYLRFLGSWRPFYPRDQVVVWLDQTTWFPLQYKVFPASGRARSEWASQMGLPAESSDKAVFTATVRSFSTSSRSPAKSSFAVEPDANSLDEGFKDSALPKPRGAPYPPGDAEFMTPRVTEGLRPWRYGRFSRTNLRPYRQTVLAYAKGLSWFTVTRVVGWNQRDLFGVGRFAEAVTLSRRSIGYYEPATDTEARRLGLHTRDGEFLVATNLPRAGLLRIARSLAVRGLPKPASWRVHRWQGGTVTDGLTLGEAAKRVSFSVVKPTYLPPGYRAAAAVVLEGPDVGDDGQPTRAIEGITAAFRRPAAELDGFGLRLYQASGQSLPPATGADQQVVMVGRRVGRWSPQDHLLEWMDGSIYLSLQGPEFDLATLVHVAESLGIRADVGGAPTPTRGGSP